MDEFIGVATKIEATSKRIIIRNSTMFLMFIYKFNRCRARVQAPEGSVDKREMNFIDLVHNHDIDFSRPFNPFFY